MTLKNKIAIIDDEEFYLDLWKDNLSSDADVHLFECFDNFFHSYSKDINFFDIIIVDMLFFTERGNFNMLDIDYSSSLRAIGFNGKLILNSQVDPGILNLENYHCYDLFLKKNDDYKLSDLRKKLEKNSVNWRKRIDILTPCVFI